MKLSLLDAAKILGISGEVTPEIVKKAYRLACSKYHPDRNAGGLEMMKSVNVAYDVLKDHTGILEHAASGFGDELMVVINALSETTLDLELCGSWLWISGDTKAFKENLKALGCKWAPSKKLWYFRPADYKSSGRGRFDMSKIREMHGSEKVRSAGNAKIKAA